MHTLISRELSTGKQDEGGEGRSTHRVVLRRQIKLEVRIRNAQCFRITARFRLLTRCERSRVAEGYLVVVGDGEGAVG